MTLGGRFLNPQARKVAMSKFRTSTQHQKTRFLYMGGDLPVVQDVAIFLPYLVVAVLKDYSLTGSRSQSRESTTKSATPRR